MKHTLDLLTELTRLVPPTAPARHGACIGEDGRLTVNVQAGDLWWSFGLEEDDMDKDPALLAAEIHQALEAQLILRRSGLAREA